MTFNRRLAVKPDKERAQRLRTDGYRDGLNGREAKSREALYQQAWRRGREEREAMQRD